MDITHFSEPTVSLWAKKVRNGENGWLPLVTHLCDTGAVAKHLWNRWLPEHVRQYIISAIGDERRALGILLFLAYIHDLGKAIPAFQLKKSYADIDDILYLKALSAGVSFGRAREFADSHAVPHALASQVILENYGCPRSIAVITGAHHGKPADYNTLNNMRIESYPESFGLNEPCWQRIWQELITFALEAGGFHEMGELPDISETIQVLLSGLVIMSDWLASNSDLFPYISPDGLMPDADIRAREGQRALPVPCASPPENDWCQADFFESRFGFKPNPLQEAAMSVAENLPAPGVMVIEAAMGTGKTEAALAATEILSNRFGCNGMFFALPTQSTSNAVFTRILKWTRSMNLSGRHSINLAHGKAQFNEDFTALFSGGENVDEGSDGEAVRWFEGSKKALLADYVVGTIDQLLFAALRQKHVMLRHLGLSGKVVVIDECHAYDAYMNQYLFRALRWLGAYEIPVIVLSATLPRVKREALISEYMGRPYGRRPRDPLNDSGNEPAPEQDFNYPVITYSQGGKIKPMPVSGHGRGKEVDVGYLRESEVDALIARHSGHPGCIGIIVNTVARAQTLYERLRKIYDHDAVTLIHSRYLPEDRAACEKRLIQELGRGGPPRARFRIIIGTQVLEQSLDIDFDMLLTDLCPMDLLLQRIGRLQRHDIRRDGIYARARCLVMLTDDGGYDSGSRAVYGDYLLTRTRECLPETISIPESIPKLVQLVYDDASPSCEEFHIEYVNQIKKKEERARSFRIAAPARNESIVGWLDTSVDGIETRAQAAVRDTDASIEVILVWSKGARYCFPQWIENGREIPGDLWRDAASARAVARLTISLPHVMCVSYRLSEVISALEEITAARFREWQLSPWLNGALILPLDENGEAELCGFYLKYDRDMGLTYDAAE